MSPQAADTGGAQVFLPARKWHAIVSTLPNSSKTALQCKSFVSMTNMHHSPLPHTNTKLAQLGSLSLARLRLQAANSNSSY